MSPRPWRPGAELDGALERGDLSYALALANEVTTERKRPLALDVGLRFLPLVAASRPERYNAWALKWLGRWLEEAPAPTIENAADVAALLADLMTDPDAYESLTGFAGTRRSSRSMTDRR